MSAGEHIDRHHRRDRDLERLLAEKAIERVLHTYSHGVDRRDWELVRSCYRDDAYDSHGSFSGPVADVIRWMRTNHASVSSSMHLITNVRSQIA